MLNTYYGICGEHWVRRGFTTRRVDGQTASRVEPICCRRGAVASAHLFCVGLFECCEAVVSRRLVLGQLAAAFKRRHAAHHYCALLACVCNRCDAAATDSSAGGTGYVEQAAYSPSTRELVVAGWAASQRENVFVTQITVDLGPDEVYRGRMEHSVRQDVAQATGHAEWLQTGFRVRIAVPSGVIGLRRISARMRLGNGTEFPLGILESVKTIDLSPNDSRPSALAHAALFLAAALPVVALLAAGRAAISTAMPSARFMFSVAVVVSFMVLVAAGWTGSSLALGFENSALLVRQDGQPGFGKPPAIRSDEWQVITPLALSQLSHYPPFPIVNHNLGADGMNMLVVGMTGMPVAHVSSLAKPASWGYFLFDLRRALAWSWWLPLFGCFGAVWMLLQRLFAIDWRLAAGLALTVAASPYSVVFSGWPAYAVFFPVVGLLALHEALRTRRWQRASAAGALLGWATAGFVLVLYPAWQISLAYLLVPVGAAWVAVTRKELLFGRAQFATAAAAVVVTAILLLSWWLDAREAVAAIGATIYPGQRTFEVGGDADRWFLIKGLLSPITMYRETGMVWGASDAGSVALFLVPAAAGSLLRWKASRQIDAMSAVLWIYIAVVLYYMFVGFSPAWAQATWWGHATSYRLDLALGLAQVLVFAWLASPMSRDAAYQHHAGPWVAGCVAAVAVAHVLFLYRLLPPSIVDTVPASIALILTAITGAGAYMLTRGQHASFFAVYGAVMLTASAGFNPLSVAPSSVVVDPEFASAVETLVDKKTEGRGIAVLNERTWAMGLTAIGMPITNSVFYYPPKTLMRSLDPSEGHKNLWNRYQRVLFNIESSRSSLQPGVTHRIDSPRLDEVAITLSVAQFDFRLLKSEAVLAPPAEAALLEQNSTLGIARRTSQWTLFHVKP
jgi:hypothetical protein